MKINSKNIVVIFVLPLMAVAGMVHAPAVSAQDNSWFADNLGLYRITESTNPNHLTGKLSLMVTQRGNAGNRYGLTILLDGAPIGQQGDGLTCSEAAAQSPLPALACSQTVEVSGGQPTTSGTRHRHRTVVRERLVVAPIGSQACNDIRDDITLPEAPENADAAFIAERAARIEALQDSIIDSCGDDEQCVCYDVSLRSSRFGPPGTGSGSARRP
jgi:hypothetical protein